MIRILNESKIGIFLKKNRRTIGSITLVALVAFLIVNIGLIIASVHTGYRSSVPDNALQHRADAIISFCGVSLSLTLLEIFICVLALKKWSENKKQITLNSLRKNFLLVSLFIILLGVGSIIGASLFKSPSYECITRFPDHFNKEILFGNIAKMENLGFIVMSVGGAVAALSIFSSIPEKVAQWLNQREERRLHEEAIKNTRETISHI